ncbi:hypothetical protein LRS58_23995 [Rhodococcus sp. BH2-1]|nr:hypothetical protein [Rhodococcus sp. BH2-1]
MNLSTWIVDIALIGMVLLQLRERPLNARELALPLGIVLFVGAKYIGGFSVAGGDLLVLLIGCSSGMILGIGSGAFTKVYLGDDGRLKMRVTAIAAVLWVIGMGFRLTFQIYTGYGSGEIVGRLSIEHHISAAGWATGLIAMALVQVVARTAVTALNGYRLRAQQNQPPPQAAAALEA